MNIKDLKQTIADFEKDLGNMDKVELFIRSGGNSAKELITVEVLIDESAEKHKSSGNKNEETKTDIYMILGGDDN